MHLGKALTSLFVAALAFSGIRPATAATIKDFDLGSSIFSASASCGGYTVTTPYSAVICGDSVIADAVSFSLPGENSDLAMTPGADYMVHLFLADSNEIKHESAGVELGLWADRLIAAGTSQQLSFVWKSGL